MNLAPHCLPGCNPQGNSAASLLPRVGRHSAEEQGRPASTGRRPGVPAEPQRSQKLCHPQWWVSAGLQLSICMDSFFFFVLNFLSGCISSINVCGRFTVLENLPKHQGLKWTLKEILQTPTLVWPSNWRWGALEKKNTILLTYLHCFGFFFIYFWTFAQ